MSDEKSRATWVGIVRTLLRQPLRRMLFFVGCAVLMNVVVISLQGGVPGVRRKIRDHAIEAEKLRQKQEWDRKEWIHGWDDRRRNPDDDNYAK